MYKVIIFDFYKTIFNPKTGELFDGINEILAKFYLECPLVLITVGSEERKRQVERLNLNRFFKKIVYCQQKTEEIFIKTISEYTLSPIEVAIVGDNDEEEIKIGKNLGATAIKVIPEKENPYDTLERSLK